MARELQCRVSRTDSGNHIAVSGRLTNRSQEQVTREVWRRAALADDPITVDLSDLTYFDGRSVLILLGTKRIVERQLGCAVDVTGLDQATRRILDAG